MSTSLVATLELGLHFPFGVLARARGLHWVFKGTVPPHTSGPLLGRLRMSSRGACADCFASWVCPHPGRMGFMPPQGPQPSRVSCWLSQSPPSTCRRGCLIRKPRRPAWEAGHFLAISQFMLKYLPKTWSEWDKTRASENPGSHVQPFLPSTRNLAPAPSGSRRTRQSTTVTSQTCTCSRPGRSKREI